MDYFELKDRVKQNILKAGSLSSVQNMKNDLTLQNTNFRYIVAELYNNYNQIILDLDSIKDNIAGHRNEQYLKDKLTYLYNYLHRFEQDVLQPLQAMI